MTRFACWSVAAALALLPGVVRADVIVVPAPAAAPVVSYYAPPVVAAPAPVVSYYAPPVTTYYAAPAPVVSYYAAPAPVVPVTTYYAAPAVSYYTAPYATTYRYGLLGRRSTTYYYP